jgi:hypothetical protein
MWVALAMLAGTLACGTASGSTSLNAFVPACGGLAGEFVYSSHALKVWVKKRTIALRTDHGEVSFSYGQQENRSLARGLRPLGGQVNIFKENSSCTALQMFGELVYPDLYPGISLRLEVRDGTLKSEYSVQPGAPPREISILYSGACSTRVNIAGDLVIGSPNGTWIERRPRAWQTGPDGTRSVSVSWRIRAGGVVGFAVGKYDLHTTLVIDPALSFSTYLANATSTSHASATGVALDSSGDSFVSGWIESNSLGTPLVGQASNHGSLDGFLIKCSPAGTILFATYFGGSGYDQILGVAVDGMNRAWVTGITESTDLPLVSPLQSNLGGYRNAFVATFSSTGMLIFSTYFGGTGPDVGNGIAADGAGNAYVVGDTQSANFPLKHPAQASFGGVQDAFVAKFSAQGTLTYSTYLGGSDADHGAAIAVDSTGAQGVNQIRRVADGALVAIAVNSGGAVYVTGGTYSRDFPVRSPFQAVIHGVGDAFVAKLDSTGANIVYSTYLGGSSGTAFLPEEANAIAVDAQGDVYVAGVTSSSDFPGNSFPLTLAGTSAAFVAELGPTGSTLIFSALIGGTGEDTATGIAIAPSGAICVAGYSSSFDFPAVAPLQTTLTGIWNAFITVVNPGGAGFSFSTLLGGSGIDEATGIAVDSLGNIHVVGQAGSGDFPLTNQLPLTHFGGFDAFAATITM